MPRKTLLAKRALNDAKFINPCEFKMNKYFFHHYSHSDIIIDDICLFDISNVLECVLDSLAAGRKVILTGCPVDIFLYQKLLLNLPKEISPLFIKLADGNSFYL